MNETKQAACHSDLCNMPCMDEQLQLQQMVLIGSYRLYPRLWYGLYYVTTQHTPKCVEHCSDGKVSYICLANFYQIFCNLA